MIGELLGMYYQKPTIHRGTGSRPVIADAISFQSIMNVIGDMKSKWLPAVRTIIMEEETGGGKILTTELASTHLRDNWKIRTHV